MATSLYTMILPHAHLTLSADHGEKDFGAVNLYDSSDNESGGVELRSSTESETSSLIHDIPLSTSPLMTIKMSASTTSLAVSRMRKPAAEYHAAPRMTKQSMANGTP